MKKWIQILCIVLVGVVSYLGYFIDAKADIEDSLNVDFQNSSDYDKADVPKIDPVIADFNLIFAKKWLQTEFENNPNQNMVISPTSLYLATSILAQGISPLGYTELQNILGNIKKEELNTLLASVQEDSYLKIANSIWGNAFNSKFKKNIKKNLKASIKPLPATTQPINDWVKEKTKGKIANLLPNMPLDSKQLLLVNAIYFQADWDEKFHKGDTQKADFKSNEKTYSVDMMYQTKLTDYYENEKLQAIRLYYATKGLHYMVIILPKENVALEDIIQNENFDFPFTSKEVHIYLPKFNIDYQPKNLMIALKKWGINSIFKSGVLDDLYSHAFVKDVIHKAKISVNEDGTEASASLGIIVYSAGSLDPPKEFKADHPFLFMIDKGLFIGVVQKPETK